MKRRIVGVLGAVGVAAAVLLAGHRGQAQPESPDIQTVLAPGLYVFQLRLDRATCTEGFTSGYVTSFFAAIDGTPGSRAMDMRLLNSAFWPEWTLAIGTDGTITGVSHQAGVTGPERGENTFEVSHDGRKFVGRGSRSWTQTVNGQRTRCRVFYDALLRRLYE